MSGDLFREFEQHRDDMQSLVKRRVEEVQLSSVAHDDKRSRATETYGVRRPSDAYEGDVALRDLRAILARFDALGYERHAFRSPVRPSVEGRTASGAPRAQVRTAEAVPRSLHAGVRARALQGRLEDRGARHHGGQRVGPVSFGDHDFDAAALRQDLLVSHARGPRPAARRPAASARALRARAQHRDVLRRHGALQLRGDLRLQ